MHTRPFFLSCIAALASATMSSAASAGWGCAATTAASPNCGVSRNWSEPDKSAAVAAALKDCRPYGRCHIMGCSANVDTQDRARALWPPCGAAVCGPSTGKSC